MRSSPSSLTVMQVLPELNTGGVERGTADMASAILQVGGRAVIASAGGRLESKLKRLGAEHLSLPLASKNPLTVLRNAMQLESFIRNRDIELVHARSRAPAWSAYRAVKRTGVPFVTTFHGVYAQNSWFKKHYNSVMAKGDRVIAISQDIKKRLIHDYAVPKERIRLIYRGVDSTYFNPASVTPSEVGHYIDHANLPHNMRFVVLPGRYTRWKGMHLLIEAMARVQTPDLCALIVGPSGGQDGYVFELEKMIRNYGLENKVLLLGPCENMRALYALASIVVSASIKPEPFGRVTAESMAMGRPTLGPDFGGAAEQIVHAESGWLYEPKDAQSLADYIDYIARLDEQSLYHVGARARGRVLDYFSVEQMVQKTLDVYAELLA